MDITSFMLGKQASGGGGGSANLQNNKTLTVTSNGSTTINPDEGYDGMKKVTLTTNVQPDLESKEVTIISNTTTTITPTQGKDGLSSVSVITNIPQPTGTLSISSNGTYDVTNYASAEVSVGGGVSKGVVFSNWDNDGYPTEAEVKGLTSIPNYFFEQTNATDFIAKLTKIVLPNTLTSIGQNCFQNLSSLTTVELQEGLTGVSSGCFLNCSKLEITTLPDSVTSINASAFNGCSSLKKISMKNVNNITGTSGGNGAFGNCSSLKQVWIGSNASYYPGGLGKTAFNNCTNLQKIYIDLPRQTVESLTNYQYAFMNNTSKTGIIVCNDDAGFIDKATFDALVIE